MPQQKVTIIETLIFSCFAGIGGMLSYAMRSLNMNEKPELGRTILEGLSSAFVGCIAMLACKALMLDWYWSGVIVGVFGWLGAQASIVMLSGVVRKKLGVGEKKNDITKNS